MSKSYKAIFENNKKWVESKIADNPEYFHELAKTQNPEYLYIGCSDSRVTAEDMIGAQPGEVFVHRNIANVINTLDMSSTAVIQYAVEHLRVKHIIVCGHYNCVRGNRHCPFLMLFETNLKHLFYDSHSFFQSFSL